MGADLFIYSSSVKALKRYGPKFMEFARMRDTATNSQKEYYQGKVEEYFGKAYGEGYYRDAYNDSNLLWKLGLDYWVWFKAFLDGAGLLHPDKAALVLQEVEDRRQLLVEIDDNEERKYFEEKFDEFTEFLRTAIRLDEPIQCSI